MTYRPVRLLMALVVVCVAASAGAAEVSSASKPLLFSPDDVAALSKAVAEYERMEATGQKTEDAVAPPPATPNIYVTGIADYGDGQWTVWANGYKISPGRQPHGFMVVGVKADQAEIVVPGEQPVHVTLRSSQTWRSRSKDVVEGIYP